MTTPDDLPPLTDEHVEAVVRSVQPHLDKSCNAWRELTDECRYWLATERAVLAAQGQKHG